MWFFRGWKQLFLGKERERSKTIFPQRIARGGTYKLPYKKKSDNNRERKSEIM